MKKIYVVLLSVVIAFCFTGQAYAMIVNSADVNGFRTFQDSNTNRIWLDVDNFFNLTPNQMISAASAQGFIFAGKTDVEQLLYSLPLSTSAEWDVYQPIMGDAPNRNLFWGAYDDGNGPERVGYAYSYREIPGWRFLDSAADGDVIQNGDWVDLADMNIWAYRNGGTTNAVPEPATMVLLGTGLVGMVLRRRKA